MTYKHIEASREARLWITQVIVPIIGVGTLILTNPEALKTVANGAKNVKNYVTDKVKKHEN